MLPFTVMMRSRLKLLISLILLTVIFVSVSCMIFLIVVPPFPMIRPIKLLCARILNDISLLTRKKMQWKKDSKFRIIIIIIIARHKIARNLEKPFVNLTRLPFTQTVSLLLRDLHDFLTGIRTILWITVDSDGFLCRAKTVLSMNVYSCARHLGDLTYGGPLATNYGSYHFRLNKNTKREVCLPPRTRNSGISYAASLAAASSSVLHRRHFHF